MEVQSNKIAASLFDGLSQSQQTQGTGTKNDLFSKMMDRMLTDAAARKREQADAAARDSAKDAAKDAAKEAAKDARDARAAEAQRRQPVHTEPKPDLTRDRTAEARRRQDAADATRAAEPKAGKDDDPKVQARQEDHRPAKAERPAKDLSRTDKASGSPDKVNADKAGADKADAATATSTADAKDAAATDESASADAAAQGETMADAGGEDMSDDAAEGQPTDQPADQPLPPVQPMAQQPIPQASDLILAGLMPAGQTKAPDSTDDAAGGADTPATGSAAPVDPTAQLAAQLAQAQAAATGASAAGQAGAEAAAKAGGKTAAVGGDAAQTADATQAEPGARPDAEALPTDDTALPDRFADLLAAAKAKVGDARQSGKHTGTEGGSRNDAQPQAPTAMQQPTPPIAPAMPVAETVAAAATGTAAKALEGIGGIDGTAATGASATSPHTHPALAAMEGIHAGIPGLDQPQAATATLRPSRGAGMPMGVHDQIAVHIKKSVADEVDQFTINLHPAELGRIDIKLDIGADGRVNAMVAVEKAQTLELLQRDSRGLERALQDAGLQTDANSLNFSLRGEGNPFAGEGRGDGKGTGSGKRGRGFGGGGDDDGSDGAVYTATLGDGRVDIRA
ncbi:flagellar hook-length control protein FliK [Azospirillum sp. TSH64]|uniref:flagellar hook-length control protein FliK n=1 Tax=Azospirillum sp. TSH64 TaxID=652740 RepID=UPI000D60997C|nr:flagellar hook-length control protein FliK [Azospirillum sp. TSH64]PWC75473.1 flagellar hook-length control protein [Azospirillum sp. TSH64]